MKSAHLTRLLGAENVLFQEQHGFSGLVEGHTQDVRVVCAEKSSKDGFHGISFWLYGDNDSWFVGLWSGIYFEIGEPDRIIVIVKELLSGNVVPRGRAPGGLPSSFCAKHGLRMCAE